MRLTELLEQHPELYRHGARSAETADELPCLYDVVRKYLYSHRSYYRPRRSSSPSALGFDAGVNGTYRLVAQAERFLADAARFDPPLQRVRDALRRERDRVTQLIREYDGVDRIIKRACDERRTLITMYDVAQTWVSPEASPDTSGASDDEDRTWSGGDGSGGDGSGAE